LLLLLLLLLLLDGSNKLSLKEVLIIKTWTENKKNQNLKESLEIKILKFCKKFYE